MFSLTAKLDDYNEILASSKKYEGLIISLIDLEYSPTKVP